MRRIMLVVAIVAVVAAIAFVPVTASAHGDSALVTVGVKGGPLRYLTIAGPPRPFVCTSPCWPAVYEESNGDAGLQIGWHCHPSGQATVNCPSGQTQVPPDTRLTP